ACTESEAVRDARCGGRQWRRDRCAWRHGSRAGARRARRTTAHRRTQSQAGATAGQETRTLRMTLDDLLKEVRERGGSDLYLTAESAPLVRVDGATVAVGERALPAGEVES